MLIRFIFLLLLRVGRCTDDLIFETKTVDVGEDVKLTCPRQKTDQNTRLFWIRIVSGKFPELLGGTYLTYIHRVNKTPRITTKQDHRNFTVHISEPGQNDTGLYYCVKVTWPDMTFLRGTFLRIKGPEPEITTDVQVSPSDPVRPGDSVTLQCSVLFDPEKKTCPGDHSVYWFRAGSDEHLPCLLYAHRNNSDECEESPEAQSTQKCVYSFSKNISSSDAGTHYCAVATCGEILFGNGRTLDIEEHNTWDLQKVNTLLFVLCGTLATGLIVIVFMFYMKKKTSYLCKAAAALPKNSARQRSQQRDDDDTWLYSCAIFTVMKIGSCSLKDAKATERERIFAAVKTFGLDQ